MAEILLARVTVAGAVTIRVFADDATQNVTRISAQNATAQSVTVRLRGTQARTISISANQPEEATIPVPGGLNARITNLVCGIGGA